MLIANEPITPGVPRALREQGRADIRVATFDEPNYAFEFLYPMILVRQPRYDTGRRAAEILFERMQELREAATRSPCREVLLQAEIVVPAECSRAAGGTLSPATEHTAPAIGGA